MKNRAFLLIAISILLASFTSSYAQLKIAHLNTNELVLSMPESDSANAVLEALNLEYTKTGEELKVDYNVAAEEYEKNVATMTELVRKTKEEALAEMMNRIQQFVENSRVALQNKQQELYQPIYIKAQNAIQEVADEQGFDYVLETGAGGVLTVPKDESLNILSLVQKKLGITVN